jgi:hypothetical protein
MIGATQDSVLSESRSNVLKLVSGTAAFPAMALSVTPLLTNICPPDAFGIMGKYVASLRVVSVIACRKYELAVVVEKDELAGRGVHYYGVGRGRCVSPN